MEEVHPPEAREDERTIRPDPHAFVPAWLLRRLSPCALKRYKEILTFVVPQEPRYISTLTSRQCLALAIDTCKRQRAPWTPLLQGDSCLKEDSVVNIFMIGSVLTQVSQIHQTKDQVPTQHFGAGRPCVVLRRRLETPRESGRLRRTVKKLTVSTTIPNVLNSLV